MNISRDASGKLVIPGDRHKEVDDHVSRVISDMDLGDVDQMNLNPSSRHLLEEMAEQLGPADEALRRHIAYAPNYNLDIIDVLKAIDVCLALTRDFSTDGEE